MKLLKNLTLISLLALAFSCSNPNYYTFKTIKHQKASKKEQTVSNANLKKIKSKDLIVHSGNYNNDLKNFHGKLKASTNSNEIILPEKNVNSIIKEVNKVQEKTAGKEELGFFEKISSSYKLNKNIKEIKKANEKNDTEAGDNQVIALVLCAFAGVLGAHRFYLGHYWQGVVQLLTGGVCGIWTLIDFIRILTGDLKPDGGYSKKL